MCTYLTVGLEEMADTLATERVGVAGGGCMGYSCKSTTTIIMDYNHIQIN